ncbi:hypothetical protein PCANC_07559 [Puccinia coronata f. sp. avenae]|uniref:Exportin-T n=1 Tax=Puccinia coronata f. sp. avenae TaxID=200324 RepID=A0A2N5VSI8_9BASI|nr:hypothetical protein PCANC_07559 [Puccinia coronata f. sp. avenae]
MSVHVLTVILLMNIVPSNSFDLGTNNHGYEARRGPEFRIRNRARRMKRGNTQIVDTEQGLRSVISSYVDSGYLRAASVPTLMTRLISLAPATQGAPDSLRDHPLNDNNQFRDALSNALASSSLGLREFGNGGEHDLSDCISQVFVHGKLPPGNSCVGMGGRTVSGIRSLVNLILEQYLGIFTTLTIQEILGAFDKSMSGLVPSERDLFSVFHDALLSVTASLTGNGVTAIEKAEECIMKAYTETSIGDSTVACFTPRAGAADAHEEGVMEAIEAAADGAVEQMAGVVPNSVLSQVMQVVRFHLANTPLVQSSFPLRLCESLYALLLPFGPAAVTSIEQLQLQLARVFL